MVGTIRTGGADMSSVEVMQNGKILDTASSKPLHFVAFLHMHRAVVAYVRSFDECCLLPFSKLRMYDVHRNMEYANLIPLVKPAL